MNDLDRAVQTVVHRCLAVQPGENVVVVVDAPLQHLGEKLRDAAQATGGEAVLTVMAPRATDGSEPPAPVAEALAASDVFIAPASKSLSHTLARKRASENGARGATMPHVTPDMLARLMAIDFDRLGERCRAVAGVLDAGDEAHVTCPRGSDLRLDLRGRHGIADDGDLTARGAFGNLPCGEGFIAPVGGEGTMLSRSLASIGLTHGHPATLTIEDGHLTAATGAEGEQLLAILREHGDRGTNVAELGVGTNEHARLTGNVLEDEKILGTVHVAFGASIAIGGTVAVPIHLDCVVTEASLTVDGTPVLRDGRYVLDA
jgi:leucyl aminopeptidase (aminopeptidase T)